MSAGHFLATLERAVERGRSCKILLVRTPGLPDRLAPFVALFSISFALLVDEIMLSAIFHVLLGAGNSVAAIALALVGLSASGIVVYLVPAFRQPERPEELYRSLMFWFATSLMASSFLIMSVPVGHGDFSYSGGAFSVQLYRLAVYNITILPFFLGGLTISVILRFHARQISRLYGADLAGAALGCVVSPLLLGSIGAPRAILYGAVPALLIASGARWARGGVARALLALPLALVAIDAVGPGIPTFKTINTMGEVHDPQYRSFAIEDGDIEYERWALDAWTIIRSDRIPQQWENFRGWGLSPTYRGPIPRTVLVNYNARFSTYVTEYDGDLEPLRAWLDADLTSLHYRLGRNYKSVLNIGGGGGREVLNALNHDAERVVTVDVSEVVIEDLMKSRLREFSGDLYFDPRVTAIADEGRTFAERSRESFDLLDFSIVGGMNLEKMDLVRVDDLFTLEAMRTYLARLTDTGVFSYVMYTTGSDTVTRMADEEFLTVQPYIPALRTLTGLRMAFEEMFPGRRFGEHVLIAGLHGLVAPDFDLIHIVVSKSPFSEAERRRFVDLCAELDFLRFYPAADTAAKDLYVRVVEAPELARLAQSIPFSIWPATDNKPFQHAFEWSHVLQAVERGALIRFLAASPLVPLGVSISLFALVVTITPLGLMLARGGGALSGLKSTWSLLAFFACIGYGYMAIEISVLLKLQLYLGKPIYGLSVGLGAFLLSSSLGSTFTNRIAGADLYRSVYASVGLLLAVGLAFAAAWDPLVASTVSEPLMLRIAIAVAAISPLAFLMGVFFPIGIKLISQTNEEMIPWVWGINGCLSVLGIFGTRISALFVGFGPTLLVGLLLYLMVAGFTLVSSHSRLASAKAGSST